MRRGQKKKKKKRKKRKRKERKKDRKERKERKKEKKKNKKKKSIPNAERDGGALMCFAATGVTRLTIVLKRRHCDIQDIIRTARKLSIDDG
jgi:hypothetical protein